MGLPSNSLAIAVFIVVALPGFIQAGIRRWARGEMAHDRELGLSVARGAVFAVALTAVYFVAFGEGLVAGIESGVEADELGVSDAREVGLKVILLYLVVPAVLALMLQRRHITWDRHGTKGWLPVPHSKYGYTTTPTAWDHAARDIQSVWIKIKRGNGEWVGGWYTKGSQVSTYPEQRGLYIDQQFAVDGDGRFRDAVPLTGLYVTINDDDLVFWTRTGQLPEQDPSEEKQ